MRDLKSGRFTDWSTAAAFGSDLNLLKAKTEKNRLESKKYESWSLLCHRKRIGLIWGEEVKDWFSSMTWQNRRIATKLWNSSFTEVWSRDKTLPGLPLPVLSPIRDGLTREFLVAVLRYLNLGKVMTLFRVLLTSLIFGSCRPVVKSVSAPLTLQLPADISPKTQSYKKNFSIKIR